MEKIAKVSNCKYKLRKLSVGLVSVGTMLTATTVMGNEVSQPTTTEVTTSPVAIESSSTSATASESTMAEAQTPTTTTKTAQLESAKVESEQISEKTPKQQPTANSQQPTANSQQPSSSSKVTPRSKRSTDSLPGQPQLMEVETITVDKEKTERTIKDGTANNSSSDKKLIKNRDGEQREIAEITRQVKVGENQNEIEVTLTVTPKEIDKGAEIIILLDTSKKMSDEDFNTAKENIKKIVTTLTSKSTDTSPNYNSRNSVRLISFYRKINGPISLTAENVDAELDKIWQVAKQDWNWGVDLQGAIHKAREIFNKEKNSGKRQHIVLFSQGEATFSFDVKDKTKLDQEIVKDPITSSNILLPWFDRTTNKANLVTDGEKLLKMLESLGFNRYQGLLGGVASNGNTLLGFGSALLGTNNPLDYVTLADLNTKNTTDFNYSKRLGEGYNHRSYYKQEKESIPLETTVKNAIKKKLKEIHQKSDQKWIKLDSLGLNKLPVAVLDIIGIKGNAESAEEVFIDYVVDYLFSKRNHVYYNHNLSAQAEAKMARDEGITFYAFDVTDPNRIAKETKSNSRSEAYTEYLKKKEEETKKLAEERNKKFDAYLKEMSDDKKFLESVNDKDKFKDILSELKIIDKFDDKVTAKKDSWKITGENDAIKVSHTSASTSWLGSTSESLTWTISKEQMQKAFESGTPLTLSYKLNIDNTKLKTALNKRRKKRSTATDTNDSLTEKIISNQISYQVNKKSANGQKLDDVTLTYDTKLVSIPEITVEIEVPKLPEKPLVEPMMPLQPAIPFVPETPNNDGLEISGGSSEIDIVEDTDSGIESGAANGAISIQENTDPLVEITVDTQPGMSGQSEIMTTIEDTKSEETDAIIGGNVIDITEDSITDNQHTESGENSTDHNQEIIEDTKPESDTISVGGQSDPIDITEDTLSNLSGQSNNDATDDTIIEDTRQTDVIIGGQANSVDMVEETQPGMSGFNEATVVEEDTRPKLQFHFDNEDPIPAINKAISQTPVTRADNNLPQTGDKDTLEAFFTITALTVIGAAGLLSKRDRKNQIN
ncbi:serum opacity factor [Streptococcus canis]|uniref:serum opacification factor n=2 Tax=Streptococcus canis TaxID=1329 RepID=UPI0010CA3D31|nr:serum opacification factor [Streptococcus canis]VTR80881.1 serum opacity factor [Streptococcus canis]